MYRRILIEKLQNYNPISEVERADKAKMMDFIKTHQDCFERSLSVGHFTGSCWLENHDGTKFLLTLHKKIGAWFQLGGHADGDNDLLRVSLKEAQEESGLENILFLSDEIFDIGVHVIPEWNDIPEHHHYDVRSLLRATAKSETIRISSESADLRWFDIPPSDNPDINRMFEKWSSKRWAQNREKFLEG